MFGWLKRFIPKVQELEFFEEVKSGEGVYVTTGRESISEVKMRDLIRFNTTIKINGGVAAVDMPGVIASTRTVPGIDQHVMVLDCDSDDAMLAAARYLHLWDIGYCSIISSKTHYWLVTDVVDSFKCVAKEMKNVPGADPLHIEYNSYRNYISIRAYARNGLPVFPSDFHTMKNPAAIRWLEAFKKHFETTIYAAHETVTLKAALGAGKVMDMAHDPSFQI